MGRLACGRLEPECIGNIPIHEFCSFSGRLTSPGMRDAPPGRRQTSTSTQFGWPRKACGLLLAP